MRTVECIWCLRSFPESPVAKFTPVVHVFAKRPCIAAQFLSTCTADSLHDDWINQLALDCEECRNTGVISVLCWSFERGEFTRQESCVCERGA